MLEASCVRPPPGVEEGASEAGGATGSRQGRRQERAELRTPARGADGAADAGEGDLEAGRRRLRERQRAAGAGNVPCGCNSGHSLTPLLLTLMGQLKVGRIL